MPALLLAEAAGLVLLAVWGARRHRHRPFSLRFFVMLVGGPLLGAVVMLAATAVALAPTAEGTIVLAGAVLGLVGMPVFLPIPGHDGLVVRAAGWIPVPTVVAMAGLLAASALDSADLVTIAFATLELVFAATLTGGLSVLLRAVVVRRRLRRHGPRDEHAPATLAH